MITLFSLEIPLFYHACARDTYRESQAPVKANFTRQVPLILAGMHKNCKDKFQGGTPACPYVISV